MTEIRLLSLWQPWASLIALGLKRYETRPWGTKYRGKLAIHATKGQKISVSDAMGQVINARSVLEDPATDSDMSRIVNALFSAQLEEFKGLPKGCIVAVVDLTDCLEMYQNPVITDSSSVYINICNQTPLERSVGDWRPGRYAWKLENIRPIAHPIECRGHQGLRRIQDAALLEAIEQQLTQTAEIERLLPKHNGWALVPAKHPP